MVDGDPHRVGGKAILRAAVVGDGELRRIDAGLVEHPRDLGAVDRLVAVAEVPAIADDLPVAVEGIGA